MSKPILHRIPDSLVERVEAWGAIHGEVNRTVAINLLIANALEADAIAPMQAEIDGLRKMVTKLALARPRRKPSPLNEALRRAAFTPNNSEFPPVESEVRAAYEKAAWPGDYLGLLTRAVTDPAFIPPVSK